MSSYRSFRRSAGLLFFVAAFSTAALTPGCDEDRGATPGRFVLGAMVFGPEGTSSYVTMLDRLGEQTIDYATSVEVPGMADVWVHDGHVFVAESESLDMRRYAIEDGLLVDAGVANFGAYGITSFGFQHNVFVAPDKAYLQNGVAQLVVWNPATMTITGTIDLPDLGTVDGLDAFPGYTDRGSVVRDGKVYFARYFTDDTYFLHGHESRIVVLDVATDAVVDTIAAPCPGLDHATIDEDGTIYFSAWVFAPGGAAALDQPATCVFRIPKSGAPSVAFTIGDLLPGLEGGVFRALGDGRAIFSALDASHAGSEATVSQIAYGDNWRFYLYDLERGTATRIESIDWNGGAQYTFDVSGTAYMLVANSSYTATQVYALDDVASPTPTFSAPGWSMRLFDTR